MPPEGSATVRLKYVGASHYREISKADFQKVGVEDQEKIRVAGESALVRAHDYKTPQVVEVSEDAADFLLNEEADDWEETEEPVEPPLKARATARRLAREERRNATKTESDTTADAAGKSGSGDAGDTVTGGTGSSTAGRGGSGRSSTRSR